MALQYWYCICIIFLWTFFLFAVLLFFPLSYHTTIISDILVTSSVPFQNIQQIESQAILWHQSGVTEDDLVIVKCVDDLSPTTDRDHSHVTNPQFWQILHTVSLKSLKTKLEWRLFHMLISFSKLGMWGNKVK